MNFKMRKLIFWIRLVIYFVFSFSIYCQEVNIEEQLKKIESGDYESAVSDLSEFKKEHPDDPAVIYLDALLTKNAGKAFEKYKIISDTYPGSKYANASIFQIYSYYYAAGNYTYASRYLDRLRTYYPASFYLKMIDNKYPDDKSFGKTSFSESGSDKRKPEESSEEVFLYTIQTGAFLVPANAEKLQKSYISEGLEAEIRQKKVAGSNFFVVYIGKFRTEVAAQNYLNNLTRGKKIEGRVVKID
jgi:tetratricopeptide (TPR) repeat protein